MNFVIREGSIQDAIEVEHQIPEFEIKRTFEEYTAQLSGRKNNILIATTGEKLIGFKVGYEATDGEFHSWLGGVLPEYRGKKIATELRKAQELWASKQGFKFISVDSYNKFSSMICMLVSNQYRITNFDKNKNPLKSKFSFEKEL